MLDYAGSMRGFGFVAVLWLLQFGYSSASTAHAGLLDNVEMAQVNRNAEITRRQFFPDENISACWPYDANRNGSPSGMAYCQVETPGVNGASVEFRRGPDIFCSYLKDKYCEIVSPQS